MTSDSDLLRQFADHGDEAAFAEVVRRQADLVYSVALRVTANPALAQDVTQNVFTLLARRAQALLHYDTIVGWLHTTTRHTAINVVRGEERRRVREHEATLMQNIENAPDVDWEQLRPILDEAVEKLGEDDRKAVLLRFFKNQSHQEVAAALGLTEDTARKRVERAVEKLRGYFTQRGVSTTSAALAVTITANSIQAAPAGLTAKITPAALAGVGEAGWIGRSLIIALMNNKIKTTLILAALIMLFLTAKFTWPDMAASTPESTKQPQLGTATLPSAKPGTAPVAKTIASVELPVAAPAPVQPIATTASSAEPLDSPRRQIDTAMDDFVNLLEAGDYYRVADTYIQLSPDMTGAQVVDSLRNNPDFADMIQMFVASTRAARLQSPVYNDTGDVATYTLDPPVEGKKLVRWKKINGAWYVDGYE